MPTPFALCADDYAMTPGVSRGIVEALDAGALTATSVMTTSPWWPESAGALRPYEHRADIGLHLNLTLGKPLAPMPELAPDGILPSIGMLIRLQRAKRLPTPEIAAEIGRQCERFVSVYGRPPDHVDGHQHVHALSAIRPIVLDVLARRDWTPWLRDSSDALGRVLRRKGRKKALVLCFLADGFRRDANRAGFSTNEGFAGFSSFDLSEDYATLFGSFLCAPGPRHLVMCHPGYVDDALRALDPVVETREQELRFLQNDLPRVLRDAKTTLGRISDFKSSVDPTAYRYG